MSRRAIGRHAVAAFVVSTSAIFLAGAIGALVLDLLTGDLHAVDAVENPVRVMLDGGLVMFIVGFPAPFLLTAISTAYTYGVVEP